MHNYDWGDSPWDFVFASGLIRTVYENETSNEPIYYLGDFSTEEEVISEFFSEEELHMDDNVYLEGALYYISCLIDFFGFDFSDYYEQLQPFLSKYRGYCLSVYANMDYTSNWDWAKEMLETLDDLENAVKLGKDHPDYSQDFERIRYNDLPHIQKALKHRDEGGGAERSKNIYNTRLLWTQVLPMLLADDLVPTTFNEKDELKNDVWNFVLSKENDILKIIRREDLPVDIYQIWLKENDEFRRKTLFDAYTIMFLQQNSVATI